MGLCGASVEIGMNTITGNCGHAFYGFDESMRFESGKYVSHCDEQRNAASFLSRWYATGATEQHCFQKLNGLLSSLCSFETQEAQATTSTGINLYLFHSADKDVAYCRLHCIGRIKGYFTCYDSARALRSATG